MQYVSIVTNGLNQCVCRIIYVLTMSKATCVYIVLPVIGYEVIEGGQKGQKVAQATNLAINKFFSLGVVNIQNECNTVARRYCALWNTKPLEQKMLEYRLPDVTYAQGINEILPDFVLFEPSTIRVNIFNRYHSSDPLIAAVV